MELHLELVQERGMELNLIIILFKILFELNISRFDSR